MIPCCFLGICGGSPSGARTADGALRKPVLKRGESYAPEAVSLDSLLQLGLQPAPPGADPPLAAVSPDYQKNSSRLLVILPEPGCDWGTWDSSLSGARGAVAPIVRWAAANGFAVAAFAAGPLAASPATAWDGVLKGSPARFVAAVASGATLPLLQAALAPLHPLLFSRLRVVLHSQSSQEEAPAASLPREVREHLSNTLVPMPQAWSYMDPFVMHQCAFQLIEERIDRWSRVEGKKYAGFQTLKENDMPGLKRMPLEVRVKRMDRDRGDDELARLLQKHERAFAQGEGKESDDEEPGVD